MVRGGHRPAPPSRHPSPSHGPNSGLVAFSSFFQVVCSLLPAAALAPLPKKVRWERRHSDNAHAKSNDSAHLTSPISTHNSLSLSLNGVRSQARCLLSRLDGIRAGAAAAAKRRGWSALEERRMEKERRAHSISLSQGRLPLRRGEFLL